MQHSSNYNPGGVGMKRSVGFRGPKRKTNKFEELMLDLIGKANAGTLKAVMLIDIFEEHKLTHLQQMVLLDKLLHRIK